jgi:hypothetical protein
MLAKLFPAVAALFCLGLAPTALAQTFSAQQTVLLDSKQNSATPFQSNVLQNLVFVVPNPPMRPFASRWVGTAAPHRPLLPSQF